MNNKWNYQPPSQEQTEAAKALAKETGISPVLCKLLLERGISSAAEAKRFFRPQLSELHDPFLMKDMDIAVDRLNEAMGRKERILVYGETCRPMQQLLCRLHRNLHKPIYVPSFPWLHSSGLLRYPCLSSGMGRAVR